MVRLQDSPLRFSAAVFIYKFLLISKEYGRPAYKDFRVQKARNDWLGVRRATAEEAERGLGQETNQESIKTIGDMVFHASKYKFREKRDS